MWRQEIYLKVKFCKELGRDTLKQAIITSSHSAQGSPTFLSEISHSLLRLILWSIVPVCTRYPHCILMTDDDIAPVLLHYHNKCRIAPVLLHYDNICGCLARLGSGPRKHWTEFILFPATDVVTDLLKVKRSMMPSNMILHFVSLWSLPLLRVSSHVFYLVWSSGIPGYH